MADERIWVELPLSIDAVVALSAGVIERWPESKILTDHGRDSDKWLCIELSGPRAPTDDGF